jgi:hypothetical protein
MFYDLYYSAQNSNLGVCASLINQEGGSMKNTLIIIVIIAIKYLVEKS